jgi:hypothetical protein
MRLALILLTALLAFAVPAASHTGDQSRCGIPGDSDCDGTADGSDNCPSVRNADQANQDGGYTATEPEAKDGSTKPMQAGDASGDACDDDDDADGVPDAQPDNCRTVRNPDQVDTNADGRGETADGKTTLCPPVDTDGDSVIDERDNCPRHVNADQADNEKDGRGDACDYDDDGDGYLDSGDNCPFSANDSQADKDGDGVGTACDPEEMSPTAAPSSQAGGADSTRPVLRLSTAARRHAADASGGLVTGVSCSEACGLKATLKVRGRTVASADGLLGARGRTWLIFTFRRGAARTLRGRRATLDVRAVDQAGNPATVRRSLRFM